MTSTVLIFNVSKDLTAANLDSMSRSTACECTNSSSPSLAILVRLFRAFSVKTRTWFHFSICGRRIGNSGFPKRKGCSSGTCPQMAAYDSMPSIAPIIPSTSLPSSRNPNFCANVISPITSNAVPQLSALVLPALPESGRSLTVILHPPSQVHLLTSIRKLPHLTQE
jgi:hypothetical protein